tara:strand:- start:82 stop:723 length:642 start_codon:yes stop_codon:yes gene_type:complete
MPLIVGIKDKEKREMFNDEERQFLASFEMGMYAMHTGIGDIGDNKYSTHKVSVDEAVERFSIMLKVFDIESETSQWLTDKDFVQKMADAKWTCNVNNESQEEFLHKVKRILFDDMWDEVKPKHITKPKEIYWRDIKQQRNVVNSLVGMVYANETRYIDDFKQWTADVLIGAFSLWDKSDEPIYHNQHNTAMYLRYDEVDDRTYLSDKSERDDE